MSSPGGDKFLQGPGLGRTQTSGSIDKGPLWPKRCMSFRKHLSSKVIDVASSVCL